MTHFPGPFDHIDLPVLPGPFGHIEWRIDRRDPRPSAVARAAALRRRQR
jgi:hypothetical protein